MPLSDDDWSEVFDHTRRRLREVGLSDVDRDVTIDFRSTRVPSSDYLHYLSRAIAAINERSLSGYRRALAVLSENIVLEDGGSVSGVEVEFMEKDVRVFGAQRLDLGQTGDYSLLVEELESLRAYLKKNGVTE